MKSIKKVVMFIFAIALAFSSMLKVNAIDDVITFTSQRQIDNTRFNSYENKALKFYNAGTTIKTARVNGKDVYAYCFNHAKEAPAAGTQLKYNKQLTEQASKYVNAYYYILENGYGGNWNTKYEAGLSSDAKKREDDKYYVTQLAIWGILYQYDSNNGVKIENETKDQNGNALSSRLQAIKNNAIALRNDALNNKYPEPTLTLSDESNGKMTKAGDYYRTGTMKTSGMGYENATITVSGVEGAEIIDGQGKSYGAKATFSAGRAFYVRIPASKVSTKEVSVNINANAQGIVRKLAIYSPVGNYQNIGVPYTTVVKLAASLKASAVRKTSSLVIAKVNPEGKYLAGATLVLKDSNGKVVEEWTTGDTESTNAKRFNNLAIGSKYTLSEKVAPKGYKKIKDITITIEEKEVNYVKVIDEDIKKTKISKQDVTTGEELPGAKLVLKDESGKVVDEWTSGTEPHYVEDLQPGKYTLSETIAPEGYQLSTETITFVVKDDYTVDGDVIMYNAPKKGITISKQDATTGKELPGAKLVLKDESGKVVDEWTSTEKPHYIDDLKDGKYTLTETIAPEGYILSTETITFTINHDGKVAEKIVMKNYPSKGVYISKQDVATAKELPGATLVVKDADGNIVDKWVSGTTPHYIPNLKEGTYTLIETKAPKGYGISDEVITFTIKNDGKAAEKVVMYNSVIPDTGDINFILIALGLIGSVVFGVFSFKKLSKQA